MTRHYWTIREHRQALQLRAEDYSYGAISALIKTRSPDAVAAHLRATRLREEEGQ